MVTVSSTDHGDPRLHQEMLAQMIQALEGVAVIDDDVVRAMLFQRIDAICQGSPMSFIGKCHLFEKLFNALRRLDILQPLLDDPEISEIMVNGTNPIFVERAGEIHCLDLAFKSTQRLENIIHRIVSAINRSVNTANPIVDARLSDGSRVSVVLPPIAVDGPVLTIRKFAARPYTMARLIENHGISQEGADFLASLVKAKYNLFISGGTGSGKTTFLNVLSQSIGQSDRVITIEDACELQLSQVKNWVRLETRNANVEGQGEITMRHLIKTALRMRPDRIVIGEVRGAEALDMLQAMNTGHDGSMSTGHANTIPDVISRLETMVHTAAQIPLEAIRQMMISAVDVFVHLARLRDGTRRVTEISMLDKNQTSAIVLVPIYKFVERGMGANGKIQGRLQRTAFKEPANSKRQTLEQPPNPENNQEV